MVHFVFFPLRPVFKRLQKRMYSLYAISALASKVCLPPALGVSKRSPNLPAVSLDVPLVVRCAQYRISFSATPQGVMQNLNNSWLFPQYLPHPRGETGLPPFIRLNETQSDFHKVNFSLFTFQREYTVKEIEYTCV